MINRRTILQVTAVVILFLMIWFAYQYYSWSLLPSPDTYPSVRAYFSDTYEEEIDQSSKMLKTLPDFLNVPSLSVAVGIKGEIIWSEAVGYADLENGIKATPNTKYRIGGSAKSVTSTAVMRLVEQGLLDLDKPINNFLPQLPESVPNITTRQLLSHTAGFGNHGDFGLISEFYSTCDCVNFNSVDEAMLLFNETPLLYNPGEDYRYSTYGYIAVSKVIESISDQPFLTFLKEELFDPLDMHHTTGDHSSHKSIPLTVFYEISNRSYRKWHTLDISPHKTNLSYNWAGGGMLSTPTDMVKMGNALVTDSTFVSFQIRNDFFSPQKLKNGNIIKGKHNALGWETNYAFDSNLSVGEKPKMWIVHSGGSKKGSGNALLLFPELQLVICVSTNGSQSYWDYQNLWNQAMRLAQPFIKQMQQE